MRLPRWKGRVVTREKTMWEPSVAYFVVVDPITEEVKWGSIVKPLHPWKHSQAIAAVTCVFRASMKLVPHHPGISFHSPVRPARI